mmetsp:Transcript_65919/g.204197  ORF Transcript_65919/g.204197 Transcript_65919/m.204197 type:complete len:385 (+) Transcript_65919:89-1243(+)
MLFHVTAVHKIAHQGYRRGQALRPVPPLAGQNNCLTLLHDDAEGSGGPGAREGLVVGAGRIEQRGSASDGLIVVAMQMLRVLWWVAYKLLLATDLREPHVACKCIVMQPCDCARWPNEYLQQSQVEPFAPLVSLWHCILYAVQAIGYVTQEFLILHEWCPPVCVEDSVRRALKGFDDIGLPQHVTDVLPHRYLDRPHLAAAVAVPEERREVVTEYFLAAIAVGQPLEGPLIAGRPPSLGIRQHHRLALHEAVHHLAHGKAAAPVHGVGPIHHDLLGLGAKLEARGGESAARFGAVQRREREPKLGAEGILRPGKELVRRLGTQVRRSVPGHEAPACPVQALPLGCGRPILERHAAGVLPREGVHVDQANPLLAGDCSKGCLRSR